jgi:hypothetical protein
MAISCQKSCTLSACISNYRRYRLVCPWSINEGGTKVVSQLPQFPLALTGGRFFRAARRGAIGSYGRPAFGFISSALQSISRSESSSVSSRPGACSQVRRCKLRATGLAA